MPSLTLRVLRAPHRDVPGLGLLVLMSFLTLWVLLGSGAEAACPAPDNPPIDPGPTATIIDAYEDRDDVKVRLAWNPVVPPPPGTHLAVVDDAGNTVGTAPVAVAFPHFPSLQQSTIQDALLAVPIHGFNFEIVLRDDLGEPIAPPYPYFVDWVQRRTGGCKNRVLAGLNTEAVLVSQALSAALDGRDGSHLTTSLEEIEAQHAELTCDVESVERQLVFLDQQTSYSSSSEPCQYLWQAIYHGAKRRVTLFHEPAAEDHEAGGIVHTPGQCYAAQALSVAVGETAATWLYPGEVQLDLRPRFLRADRTCSCSGTVTFDAEYEVCLFAESHLYDFTGSSHAVAFDLASLEVNDDQLFDLRTHAETELVPADFPTLTFLEAKDEGLAQVSWEGSAPALATLQVLGTTAAVTHRELLGLVPEASYALADLANSFVLTAETAASCTVRGETRSRIVSPDYLVSAAYRDGGIKIKRWKQKNGG